MDQCWFKVRLKIDLNQLSQAENITKTVTNIQYNFVSSSSQQAWPDVGRPLIVVSMKVLLHMSKPRPQQEHCIIEHFVGIKSITGEYYIISVPPNCPCQCEPPPIPSVSFKFLRTSMDVLEEMMSWMNRKGTHPIRPG